MMKTAAMRRFLARSGLKQPSSPPAEHASGVPGAGASAWSPMGAPAPMRLLIYTVHQDSSHRLQGSQRLLQLLLF